jgi:glutathione S-transferase
MPDSGYALIEQNDGAFKAALDRTKYPNRFPHDDPLKNHQIASEFLQLLNEQLQAGFLFGPSATLADSAILPFVRQFAFIDRAWFDAQPWPYLQRWLEGFLSSDAFHLVMQKYPKWQDGDPPTLFPSLTSATSK